MFKLGRALAAAYVMLVWCVPVAAQENAQTGAVVSHAQLDADVLPLWETGVLGGGYIQPAYPGAEQSVRQSLVLPFVIYRGQYLRADKGGVGLRALKTPRTEVDVGLGASLGSRAADIEARRGMDDLGLLLEFGPRLKINLGDVTQGVSSSRLQFSLRGVFDVYDYFSYHGLVFEPQWVYEFGYGSGWSASFNLGAIIGEQMLADTYYRVKISEATPSRAQYDARSGLIALRSSVFATYSFSREARIFVTLRYDSEAQAANYASPLLRRDSGWSALLGMAWTLAYSERRAND